MAQHLEFFHMQMEAVSSCKTLVTVYEMRQSRKKKGDFFSTSNCLRNKVYFEKEIWTSEA
jgi:hypothetical protein